MFDKNLTIGCRLKLKGQAIFGSCLGIEEKDDHILVYFLDEETNKPSKIRSDRVEVVEDINGFKYHI